MSSFLEQILKIQLSFYKGTRLPWLLKAEDTAILRHSWKIKFCYPWSAFCKRSAKGWNFFFFFLKGWNLESASSAHGHPFRPLEWSRVFGERLCEVKDSVQGNFWVPSLLFSSHQSWPAFCAAACLEHRAVSERDGRRTNRCQGERKSRLAGEKQFSLGPGACVQQPLSKLLEP